MVSRKIWAKSPTSSLEWTLMLISGVIIVCVMVMTPYLKRTVSAPLAEITQVASRLEKGDLGLASGQEISISVHSNDEVGDLAQSVGT